MTPLPSVLHLHFVPYEFIHLFPPSCAPFFPGLSLTYPSFLLSCHSALLLFYFSTSHCSLASLVLQQGTGWCQCCSVQPNSACLFVLPFVHTHLQKQRLELFKARVMTRSQRRSPRPTLPFWFLPCLLVAYSFSPMLHLHPEISLGHNH